MSLQKAGLYSMGGKRQTVLKGPFWQIVDLKVLNFLIIFLSSSSKVCPSACFSSLIPFSPFCAYAPETLKLSALTLEQLWNDLIVGGWLIQPKWETHTHTQRQTGSCSHAGKSSIIKWSHLRVSQLNIIQFLNSITEFLRALKK